jgi:hypothetical protein
MRRLLFLHIHKTAGTSLKRQLLQSVPPREVCPYPFEWQVRQADYATLSRFTFFFGHISPLALPFTPSSFDRITMLREPRVRLLSAFAYWKKTSNLHNEFFRAVAPLTLLQFLRDDSPLIRQATWNVQARLLAGGHFGTTDELRTNVIGPDIDPNELANQAEENFGMFTLIGTVERYAESLRLARTLLGLPDSPVDEVHNRSGVTPESYVQLMSDPDVAEALHARTAIEARVYAAAMLRLDEQLKRG